MKLVKKSVVIGIVAGCIVFLDCILANLLKIDASFAWIAFINWTVFFTATSEERLKALVNYPIGFLAAIAMIRLGNCLSFLNIGYIAIGSILGSILINFLCIMLEGLKKIFPISLSGIFVGIALTFSGVGIGLGTDTIESAMTMLAIIVLYGLVGLLCGWANLKFAPKDKIKE